MGFVGKCGVPEYKNHQKILTPISASLDVPFLRNERLGYHYTGIEKFKSIVSSRRLWLSSLADVNDSAEIADGASVFADFALKFPERAKRDSEWWKNLVNETVESELAEYFVFCLTLDEDSHPMWELYAGNGGCCIGFNYSDLVHSLLEKNFETLKGGEISYGMVVYDCRDKIRIFKTYMKACGNAVSVALAKVFNTFAKETTIKSPRWVEAYSDYENEAEKEKRFTIGVPDFAFFKNRAFRYENELRVAVRIPKERQEALEKLGRIRREGSRRFLCLDFDLARSIKRIYSAPKFTGVQRDEILCTMETAEGLKNVRFWTSSSTIR